MANLDRMFNALGDQMKLSLERSRAKLHQRGNIGAGPENEIRELFEKYLPPALSVGHGEVVDKAGRQSGQTDLVIINQHHPFKVPSGEPGIFLIEGVEAVGEIKSVLTTKELEKAITASRRFKELAGWNERGDQKYGNMADINRYISWPPYFLLAVESQITLRTICERLAQEGHYPDLRFLDGVFVLDRGWAIDFGDGTGTLKFTRASDGTVLGGWQLKETANTVFDLFAWLSVSMPAVSRAGPVFPRYVPSFNREA